MNTTKIKVSLYQTIDKLPDKILFELNKIINDFLAQKNSNLKPTPQKRKFGCMKGLVVSMADDFNAPIDDFKEYM